MQYISLFLASSLDEFAAQRESLGDFVRTLNDQLIGHGVYLELFLCEDMSKTVCLGRKQEQYNEKIRQCQYFYLLFGQRVGPSTLEEYRVALQQFRVHGVPKPRLFFLPAAPSAPLEESALQFLQQLDREPDLSCCRVSHLDAVKLDLLQELVCLPALQRCLTFREEAVLLNGEPVLSTEHIRDRIPGLLPEPAPAAAGLPAPDLQYIRLFLEAEGEEWTPAQRALGDFVRTLNDLYIRQGLYFQLTSCCRPCPQGNPAAAIRRSQYFYLLFGQRMGPQAQEHFNLALEQFQATQAPQIEVFFRRPADGQLPEPTALQFIQRLDREVGHYFCQFTHLDSVKLDLLMELARDPALHSTVAFQDGKVLLDNRQLLSLENIPLYRKNTALQQIVRDLAQLDQEFDLLTEQIHRDPDNEEWQLHRLQISRRCRELGDQLKSLENELLALYRQVQDKRTQPGISRWEWQALLRIDQGDYEGAKAILRDQKWEEELQTAQDQVDEGLNGIRQYISGKRTLIQLLRASSPDPAGWQEIHRLYEKLTALAEQYHIELDVLYDYASFLHAQRQYPAGIAVAERLRRYEESDFHTPQIPRDNLLNLLGLLYHNNRNFAQAEACHRQALDIRRRLAKEKPEAYLPDFADSCNNLAILLNDLDQKQEAEPFYRQALAIYRRLAQQNPDAYTPDLAKICNNLANLLHDLNQNQEAEQLHRKALTIYRRLAQENPDAYLPDFAASCNNLAVLLTNLQQDQEVAEQLHRQALAIRRRLVQNNPYAYVADLAGSCNNLAILLVKFGRPREAEPLYREALAIRRRLAQENPDAYIPALADSCGNLANLLQDLDKTQEAEAFYREAVDLYRPLAAKKNDAHTYDLAAGCNNLAILLQDRRQTQEAEAFYREALVLQRRLVQENPDAYLTSIAASYNNLTVLLESLGQPQKVESLYQEELDLYRSLEEKNPGRYTVETAACCFKLVVLLCQDNRRIREAKPLLQEAIRRFASLDNPSPEVRDSYETCLALYRSLFGEN